MGVTDSRPTETPEVGPYGLPGSGRMDASHYPSGAHSGPHRGPTSERSRRRWAHTSGGLIHGQAACPRVRGLGQEN